MPRLRSARVPKTGESQRLTITKPNLGLYLDRPSIAVPDGGLVDCLNIRLKNGAITNENMGWGPFNDVNLDDNRVLLIDEFFLRDGTRILIFGTADDLYYWDTGTSTVKYITPNEDNSDAAPANGFACTGGNPDILPVGTNVVDASWAGCPIWIGDHSYVDQHADWYEIDTVVPGGLGVGSVTLTEPFGGAGAGYSFTVRNIFKGDADQYWISETFPDSQADWGGGAVDEDEWYATNGTSGSIVVWNGNDETVTIISDAGHLNMTCGTLLRYKGMMLYGDILESGENRPQNVINSALTDPSNTSTLEAGEVSVSEGVDTILALVPLGDVVVCYGDRSVNMIQYVGTPLNFLIRTAVPGVGCVSARSIVNFGDFHEFLGQDTAYKFDGVSLREHGGHVFREVLRQIDQNRLEQAVTHIDEENAEVLWIVPLTTDTDPENGPPEYAFSEHYLEQGRAEDPVPIAKRTLPATATGFYERSTILRFNDAIFAAPGGLGFDEVDFRWNDRYFAAGFPLNLFGDDDGNIYELGVQNTQDGTGVHSHAHFGRFAVMDGINNGIIKRLEPGTTKRGESDGLGLITVIWVSGFVNGDASQVYSGYFDMTHATRRHMSIRKAALYAEVQFGTIGSLPWDCIGYSVDSVMAGSR